MGLSKNKLKKMVEDAIRYETWDGTDDIDSMVAFTYARKAVEQVKDLVKEVYRLQEFEWKYESLQK